jgi:phenylalanyl-tRNA synthetase alpha chain
MSITEELIAQLRALESEGGAAIGAADGAEALEAVRIDLLGRKGRLTGILRRLGELSPEERPAVGAEGNRVRDALNALFDERTAARAAAADTGPREDLTLPGRAPWRGGLHPVRQVVDEICEIFRDLGFSRVAGPEVETAEYNFAKLNFPLDHPAADMHDTFYLGEGTLLRTHTSPMQARIMEAHAPPIRVVIPGTVYRRDPFDASHAPAFEQIEGLAVDEGVTFADFKATLAPVRAPLLRPGREDALPPVVLPIHGAFGGGGRVVHDLRRLRLLRLQGDGVDGDHGRRDGASQRLQARRHRSRALHRLRLRDGAGAHRDAALRNYGHSPAL